MSSQARGADDLPQVFAPGGSLQRALPDYEPRSCQLSMAEFVAAAIESDSHALVEAGTGTGKSLAYLVPALRSEKQTIVSTATKALQDQLWQRDLPLAQAAADTSVATALLKGRANYLCLLSLDEQTRLPELGVAAKLGRVQAWARSTKTGDVDELGADASAPLRSALTRGVDTCEGRLCPFHRECWAERARWQAGSAQIVVTNHHLLFADAKLRQSGGDTAGAMPLPAAPLVVLDEAHTLEDAATSTFAAVIDAERAPRLLNGARVRAGLARRFASVCSAALRANTDAFESLERLSGFSRTALTEEVPAGVRLAREAWTLVEAAQGIGDADERAWLERRLRELAMDAERVFRPDDPDWVHYVERNVQRGLVASAAPIQVDRLFRANVAARHTVVNTSATLAVGQSFNYVKTRLGLHGAETLITEPAFDYARQALVYIAEDLPAPPAGGGSSAAYDAAIAGTIERLVHTSGGRAFCLFTSHRALADAWGRLEGKLPFAMFRQGQGATTALLERFRASGDGVLFGTRSFWEGVDVPGEALSLVIIARMPFAAPDDPVVAARTERLRAEGEDWFGGYALPRATLLLKQGFGRLIRSSRDRGVVAILDSRVTNRSYGGIVLSSLPPARRSYSLQDVRAFFDARPQT